MTSDPLFHRLDALRRIPLSAVLRATGARPDPYDRAKWHTAQGSLSITGMKFMNWNQSRGGGGAIDLVMHLHHLNFSAALAWLDRHCPLPPDSPPLRRSPRPCTLPPADPQQLSAVKRYLLQQRALPLALLQSLIDSRRLYADHLGNAVFPWWGPDHRPVGAELRGTGPTPWRGMAPGSQKDLGYFSFHPPGATTIVLCESAIDALSCSCLHPACRSISTAGARPHPRWLPDLVASGHPVYCGFDADATGEAMAQQMMSLYPSIQRLRPSQHDWNDVLRFSSRLPAAPTPSP